MIICTNCKSENIVQANDIGTITIDDAANGVKEPVTRTWTCSDCDHSSQAIITY